MSKKIINLSSAVAFSFFTGMTFAADIKCNDYNGKAITIKPKTITIYNNSEGMIYPVIATSKNAVNEWLQGCFRSKNNYPTKYVYKLYVNEGEGIAPGSSVTITLPLYSKITDDQYITWWNGGRVVLADDKERLINTNEEDVNKDNDMATPGNVTCEGQGTQCNLSTYYSNVQFPENIYAQLSEYTFGDSIVPPEKVPGQAEMRVLKPENVGYNISYVDHVYLPIAIGTKNNPYIGYSGSTQSLSKFREHLDSFLRTSIGQGWPIYNLTKLKLPGGYNIFAQRSGTLPPSDHVPVKPKDGFPPVLTVLSCIDNPEACSEEDKKSLHFGASVQRMQDLWGSCVDWGNEDVKKYVKDEFDCSSQPKLKENLEAVYRFFKKNHEQYLEMYKTCVADPEKKPPVAFNYWEAIKHIYGWVPFNEECGAAANPLVETKIPGWNHVKIQAMYIHELQYNYNDEGKNLQYLFNPYVKLIHDNKYLDMDAYGFSVDDAVGFMSELGDGLVFAVGGTHGLENKQQFNYADGFLVAIGVPKSQEKDVSAPLIKKYNVCVTQKVNGTNECLKEMPDVVMPDNSQIAGFRVGTVDNYPIKVQFTDLNNNVYSFVVKEKFDPCLDSTNTSQCPTNKAEIVDKQSCVVKTSEGVKHPNSDEWCDNANPNQQKEKQLTKNFISFPQPVDFMGK